MIGFVTLILTCVMIYTLVKNALVGNQINISHSYDGKIDLIIPITSRSEFYLNPWLKSLQDFRKIDSLKVHILIDGHHESVNAWQELKTHLTGLEIHSFLLRPLGREATPWMIDQIANKLEGDIIIIGDPELVPSESLFQSIGRLIEEKKKSYFILPQTAKLNILGESIEALSPTLALTSFFGFRKIRRNISHPLLSISEGYLGMARENFKHINWDKINISSWKEGIIKAWELENKSYLLAFGEKHLQKYYPEDMKAHFNQLKLSWSEHWLKGDKMGIILYFLIVLIWSFPLIFFINHPYWAFASFLLLFLYRFFSKIVFQESWAAMILHFFACLMLLASFISWILSGVPKNFTTKKLS